MIMLASLAILVASPALGVAALGNPGLVTDGATLGAYKQLKVEHLYYDNFPTGVAVTASGRMFSNYPRPSSFTLGELVNGTHEAAFPSQAINSPPSLVNDTNPAYGSDYPDYLISLQQVVVDPLERLWALDTGRPTVNGTMLLNSGGGKLVRFDLASDSPRPAQTIVFPPHVAYPETFLNDVRFDLRAGASRAGKGVAYITDSSTMGRSGIIVVDLGTGQSWRHLDMHPSVLPEEGFRSSYNGQPFLPVMPAGPMAGVYGQLTVGSDGIAISSDGEYLYYTPLASRTLYRVPTSYLRVPSGGAGSTPGAALGARGAVQTALRLPSHADGLEQDDAGRIYASAPEHNAVYAYTPSTGALDVLVRDPRVQWPDTLAVTQGRMYLTVNQYWLQPGYQNGTEKRTKPYALLSVPIEGGPVKLK